jgi:hypothetical protein
MQAIELTANITPDHELRVRLPGHAATGPARVIILFESDSASSMKGNLDDFLECLPRNVAAGVNHAQIMQRIDDERSAWGDV